MILVKIKELAFEIRLIFEPLKGQEFSVMLLTENELIGSPTEADA